MQTYDSIVKSTKEFLEAIKTLPRSEDLKLLQNLDLNLNSNERLDVFMWIYMIFT